MEDDIIRVIEELPFSDEDKQYFTVEIRKGFDEKLAEEIVARVHSLSDTDESGKKSLRLILKQAQLIGLIRGRLRKQKITKFWRRLTGK